MVHAASERVLPPPGARPIPPSPSPGYLRALPNAASPREIPAQPSPPALPQQASRSAGAMPSLQPVGKPVGAGRHRARPARAAVVVFPL